jgi:type I restriction enzyme M protein
VANNGIVQKLWNYCNLLRDDGLSYGDYVEQLTFLLFLKMADEQDRLYGRASSIPKDKDGNALDWSSLLSRDGDALEVHYRHVLTELGRQKGMLGVIFRKAQNKIQDPAKLRRLISDLIDKEEWISKDADVKGDAYEGLLERRRREGRRGTVLYAPRADPRDRGRDAARAGANDPRSGMRYRRVPPGRARLRRKPQRA